MARTSNLANVATVSRATKAWYPGGWDFTNGGAITGDFVEYANNVARDGAQGLLVEEASTNEIRNPRGEGISGGNEPTNWINATAWDAITTFSSGTENGWPYVDVAFSGTPTGDNVLSFDGQTQIAALTGQSWSLSCGVKVVSGDFTNIDAFKLRMREATSGGSFVVAQDTGDLQGSIDSTHRRFVNSATLSGGGTTAFVGPQILISWSSGAVNLTLRIYAPQLEEKAYPTSPILPPASSPAESDRNADDIEVASGAWLASNDGPFSLYAEVAAVRPAPENSNRNNVVALSDGSFSNVASLLFLGSPHELKARTQSGGGSDTTSGAEPNVASTSGTIRLAAGWDTDNFAYSASGGTQATDTSVTLPVGMDRLQLGADPAGRRLNGYIKNVRYWPRRLTNAELEALVGN